MILSEWLRIKNLTNARFAQAIGTSEESVRLYRAGLRRPQPHIAQRILAVTKNAVTPADLHLAWWMRREAANHEKGTQRGQLDPV